MLVALDSNIDRLKADIFTLLNKNKRTSRAQVVDKSILSLIQTSKILTRQFDDQVITQEILLLSFTYINDKGK